MRRVRCVGLEAVGRAYRDAYGHGYPGASVTRGYGGHRDFPSYLHSRPSDGATACHSHSIRASEPNADRNRDADVDLDAVPYSNHNANANANRNLYVNSHAHRDCHGAFPNGNISFAHGHGPVGNSNSANGNVYPRADVARAAHLDPDGHRNIDRTSAEHGDPNGHADLNALKECPWT